MFFAADAATLGYVIPPFSIGPAETEFSPICSPGVHGFSRTNCKKSLHELSGVISHHHLLDGFLWNAAAHGRKFSPQALYELEEITSTDSLVGDPNFSVGNRYIFESLIDRISRELLYVESGFFLSPGDLANITIRIGLTGIIFICGETFRGWERRFGGCSINCRYQSNREGRLKSWYWDLAWIVQGNFGYSGDFEEMFDRFR